MAAYVLQNVLRTVASNNAVGARFLHGSPALCSVVSGRHKPTRNKDKPLTYEQAYIPERIAHAKSWNSWNTTTLEGGRRMAETLIDDLFIRKFITGTFHNMVLSEVIIKRQHNIVRIAAIMFLKIHPLRLGFLIGYTEEMLGYWLQCPVKLELQFTRNKKDVIFKYI